MSDATNKLSREALEQQAVKFFADICHMNVGEILYLCGVVFRLGRNLTVSNAVGHEPDNRNPPVTSDISSLIRQSSRIEKDREIKQFIFNLQGYHTIEQIHSLLSKQFGPGRTPSESSLHRFLQKLGKRSNTNEKK